MSDIEVFPSRENQSAIMEGAFPDIPKRGRPAGVSASQWLTQIEACERKHQWSFSQAKRNVIKYKNRISDDRITVPMLTPMVEVKSALATFRDPYISIRPMHRAAPTTPEEILGAAVKETYINWLWRQINMKDTTRRVTKDALLLTGLGITCPGYTTIPGTDAHHLSYDTPIASRVSPMDYFLDCEADASSNAYYGVRCIYLPIPIAEAMFKKKPGTFKPIKFSRWGKIKQQVQEASVNLLTDYRRTILYEVQDLMSGKFLYVTPGYSSFLDSFNNPYPIDGLLPEFLEPMPIPDDIDCISEASLIIPQLDELNQLREFWCQHWKRLLPKYLTEENAATEEQLDNLRSADENEFCQVRDPAGIRLLEVPNVHMDLQYHEMAIKDDIRNLTGFNEYMAGGGQGKTKTAYETQRIEAGSGIRISDLNDFVEKHCANVARKLLAIATAFLTSDEMREIVGLPADLRALGLPFNIEITDEVIKRDCLVTIQVGSMTLPSKADNPQKAMMLLQLMQFPEVNRPEQLAEVYNLLELDAGRFLTPQGSVDPNEVAMSKQALMTGGKGREMGGSETGTMFGARQRPELMRPSQ